MVITALEKFYLPTLSLAHQFGVNLCSRDVSVGEYLADGVNISSGGNLEGRARVSKAIGCNISMQKIELLIYQSSDGSIKIDVRMELEAVWLTQDQMGTLFGKATSTINEHIGNIYKEGELQMDDTMRKFGNSEFSTKPTNFYNLDVIMSVGY